MGSYIYIIENKVTGAAYVGKSNDVRRRWYKHQTAAKTGAEGYLYRAMRKYGIENFNIHIADEAEDEVYVLNVLEPEWIQYLQEMKVKLYNLTDGGDGIPGFKHSEEAKLMIGLKNSQKNCSEETKEKLRKINSGKSVSDEARKKISAALQGVKKPPRSKEHCEKLSKACNGRVQSVEEREKRSLAMKSSEKVGHPIDEDTRAKISEKLRNQVQSAETRKKRSESMKKAWEKKRRDQESPKE
jgi:group I intron endonuclease